MNKLSKCIILADRLTKRLSPLTKDKPVYMLPVFNKPLVEHTIHSLIDMGINDIVFAASRKSAVNDYVDNLKRSNGIKLDVRYIEDDKPRGTAGILKDLSDFIGNESFLVVSSNTFIGNLNLNDFKEFHEKKHSSVTVGVQYAENFLSEGVHISDDNRVRSFYNIHSSVERRTSFSSLGIYIFNPEVLNFIKPEGYFDINEQLIPLLQNVPLDSYTYEIEGRCKAVNSIEDYYDVLRESLFNGHAGEGYKQIAEGIWIGKNVSISPDTYIIGPVLIGDNCTIEDGAQVIGPSALGNNCRIDKKALIRESILFNDCSIQRGAALSYCIAMSGLNVGEGEFFRNMVVVDNINFGDINLLPYKYKFNGISGNGTHKATSFKYLTFQRIKRVMDIILASFGLVVFSPVMLLIAIAIRLDSRGSAVYLQKRCGKDGKEFKMLKFRTMVQDAEKLQAELASRKDVDGPMFKLTDDPRVTRVGKFLRKSSFDELPQFINVLKGDMSLVGPRPLIMDEMKFCSSWRDIRLKVKPGLTGVWQVEGRSDAPFHSWISHDLYYVENQSIWLDIKILFKTVKVIFKRAGAY